MSATLLLIAVGLLPPQMDDSYFFDLFDRIPKNSQEYIVKIEMVVDPDGKTQSCDVKNIVGTEFSRETYCSFFTKKRVRPAKSEHGTPMYGVWSSIFYRFDKYSKIGKNIAHGRPAEDIMLSVNRLPTGISDHQKLTFTVRVENDGKISACKSQEPLSKTVTNIICSRTSEFLMPVISDNKGHPVPYITLLTASFTLQLPTP